MFNSFSLAGVSTGTDNQESVPTAKDDNILPPMPPHSVEKENIPWTVFHKLH